MMQKELEMLVKDKTPIKGRLKAESLARMANRIKLLEVDDWKPMQVTGKEPGSNIMVTRFVLISKTREIANVKPDAETLNLYTEEGGTLDDVWLAFHIAKLANQSGLNPYQDWQVVVYYEGETITHRLHSAERYYHLRCEAEIKEINKALASVEAV